MCSIMGCARHLWWPIWNRAARREGRDLKYLTCIELFGPVASLGEGIGLGGPLALAPEPWRLAHRCPRSRRQSPQGVCLVPELGLPLSDEEGGVSEEVVEAEELW